MNPQDPIQFLTIEEATAIDRANLTAMDKFMTRITISSMRILSKIAMDLQLHGEHLTPQQVVQWVEKDALVRRSQGVEFAFLKWDAKPEYDLDFADPIADAVTNANLSSHEKFLTRMVISAIATLTKIAQHYQSHLEELTASQVVQYMEQAQDQALT
ncbi:MAG: hypothetical protein NW214_01805 [Pseudanabaenaceae cyanobacterium bins.39]|nr:hypothetical protein [Pseudanabaenaceae cyanobacterium bins.39]